MRYNQLYTAAVVDVLDEMGHHHQTLDPVINPLINGMTKAGIAFSIIGRYKATVDPESNIRNTLQMLGEALKDAVLVYQTNDERAAQIGELSVTALEQADCRGAVVDGGARDTAAILEHNLPVFLKHRTPADAVPRWEILDWGIPAVIGGVEISSGDIVVGDMDGVVSIPRELSAEVLSADENLANAEDEVRDAVSGGMSPIDAYEKYGTF